jgi:hypothetical protein
VVVGARFDDDGSANSGSAYIYEYANGSWHEITKLTASDAAANDYFGVSVAISGDRVVVGAYADDSFAGSAYIYEYVGSNWSQTAKLTASDAAVYDNFGWSVAISGDRVVVGAVLDDDGGTASGSAYIYDLGLTPEQATQELMDLVETLDIAQGLKNSFDSKLQTVLDSLAVGDTQAAIGALNAFINQANAQRGKQLTNADADLLIAEAQAIIDLINAGSLPKLSSETTPTSVPAAFQLEQNYPNPFNPTTSIRFSIPEAATVQLTVYDINGREVRSLVSGSLQAGEHQIQWDATGNNGTAVASGIYIYRLQAGSFVQTRKMTLLR